MPAKTAGLYPYPLPTEPVRDGALRVRELAEHADSRSGALIECSWAGTFNIPSGSWVAVAVPGPPVNERDMTPEIFTWDTNSPQCALTGWYDIQMWVRFAVSNGTGRRMVGWSDSVASSPTTYAQVAFAGVTGIHAITFRDMVARNAGRVMMWVFQDSGAALAITQARTVARYVSSVAAV